MTIDTIWIAAVIFLASLLQGVFGFAFMLIALPLLSFLLSMKVAVPLLSFFLALLSGILAFQLRDKFDYRGVVPLLLGGIAGIPAGIFFLLKFNDTLIKAILGIVLILYSAYSLFLKRVPFRFPGWAGYLFGFFAGALGGAFNITGPPVVFYLSAREGSKIDIIGSLNFFFCVTSILVLALHTAVGNITYEITMTFLELIPVMLAGMLAGGHILKKMNEDIYRKGLFLLLFVMGVMLLL
ncbi:MAG: sulfite exporter TauE/SafE family protein [Alphaproteobacteria bacterium]|uniref:Probable membrane transporter protein n=1 Tax=Candidatus Nitrobium versatile TaxID=2884831 RepID=A0A953LVL0_9BACT|nr:sulfite exporter TauE/SafE family protein [Candidatus Nitrobium versatile]